MRNLLQNCRGSGRVCPSILESEPAAGYVGVDALAAADDIDAVYIATPNIFHEEQAVKLLASGKHVLVEKPAAVSAEAYEHMSETAKYNGVILMEGMMPLYHAPDFMLLKD